MDVNLKTEFSQKWDKYFPGAELPLAFFYADDEGHGRPLEATKKWRCVIGDLTRARRGTTAVLDSAAIGCGGGRRYFGFTEEISANFEYFLSCGLPGKVKGERYKKTPQLVKEGMDHQPGFDAPGKYIVFKRWDHLESADEPLAVIFFAAPDALAGLTVLANFDQATPYGVIAPFGSGCSSIVAYPYREYHSDNPRAVLGMFDISARPYVGSNILTLAVPWPKFVTMAANMDESFLVTDTWKTIRDRIGRSKRKK